MQEHWLSVTVNSRSEVEERDAPYPYHKTTLPNGVRVVTGPMTGVKSGTLIVSYSVGSRHEPAPISGVSHFLEHMLFKGTERRPDPKQISEGSPRRSRASAAYSTRRRPAKARATGSRRRHHTSHPGMTS
ncbi:MAG: processing protease [Thermomicrobiales bacterium]|nr:processing protease [Thermomicrobiales bacterium]